MAKTPMSEAQKYRKANARGLNRDASGLAKTKVANRLQDAGVTPAARKMRQSALDDLERKYKTEKDVEAAAKGYKAGGKLIPPSSSAEKAPRMFMKKASLPTSRKTGK